MPSPLVLHIPHSSVRIPEEHRALILLDDEALARELHCLTDWFTDDLFDVPGCEKVLFKTSRLILDPERFTDDAEEVMASRGIGVIYTHASSGGRLDAWPSEEAEGLISFIGCYPRVEDVVVNSFLDAHEGYDGGRYGPSKAEWTAWLKSDPKIAEACSAEIVAWLEDTNLGDYDIEAAETHSNTPQSAALSLWRERPEELEPFNVEIVEGSCPGSTYYAAVLRSSIKEANELAISLGLPIRFRHV